MSFCRASARASRPLRVFLIAIFVTASVVFTAEVPAAHAQVAAPAALPQIALDAGRTAAGEYVAPDGQRFGPDRFYSGGEARSLRQEDRAANFRGISETGDPSLFEHYRVGKAFRYAIPLADGQYVLTLGFTEPYEHNRVGQRVFDVSANGETLLDDFDILREIGHTRSAVTRRFTLAVTGGMLDLRFNASQGTAIVSTISVSGGMQGAAGRAALVDVLTRIAEPVLEAAAAGELHERLPVRAWEEPRRDFTHYEAFARTLAGIAPWLELGPDTTAEGRLRAQYIDLARQALINATDPRSPDYMNFDGEQGDQPLVEAAYLASALMSAPKQLFQPLAPREKENVLDALRMARTIELRHENNWILFPAMVEAALWDLGADFETEPIVTAVERMEEWYEGDGVYGDGWDVAWDYYNSYAIHPMLLQVLRVAQERGHPLADEALPLALARGRRYAEVLERQISPEATFPVIGRSSNYRFAAFYHLSFMALTDELPEGLHPGAIRSGVAAVVRRMVGARGTFDSEGWLQPGAVGYQPGLNETYTSTGSLYIALTGLVHLGLPADHPFWMVPDADWTQKRIWAGQDVPRDGALEHGTHQEGREE